MDSPISTPTQRDATGRWLPGGAPPAGRPKGSVGGRARALILLDSILAEDEFQRLIGDGIRDAIRKNPMRFFRQIIMPLLPHDIRLRLGEEGAIRWVSILTTNPMPPNSPSTTIDVTDSAPSVAEGDGARPALPPPNFSTLRENAADSTPG
jgi:hypothetical protein